MRQSENLHFAADTIGVTIKMLLTKYTEEEVRKMLTTEKMHQAIDLLSESKLENNSE